LPYLIFLFYLISHYKLYIRILYLQTFAHFTRDLHRAFSRRCIRTHYDIIIHIYYCIWNQYHWNY